MINFNKVKRAFNNPVKTLSLINRRYLGFFKESKDTLIDYEKTWIYGRLKRVDLKDIFPGIEKITLKIINPYKGTYNMSLTINEVVAINSIISHLKCKKVLEIGTYDGGMTLNIAANMSSDGEIITIDLPPSFKNHILKIAPIHNNKSEISRIGQQFKHSDYTKMITQIFKDSASINFEEFGKDYDFILIDGCHDFKYVKSDTENALKIIKKGGIIALHDYGMIKDVSKYVDSISTIYKISPILGTRIAIIIA